MFVNFSYVFRQIRVPVVILSSYFLPVVFSLQAGFEIPRSSLGVREPLALVAATDLQHKDGLVAFGEEEEMPGGFNTWVISYLSDIVPDGALSLDTVTSIEAEVLGGLEGQMGSWFGQYLH